MRLSLLFLLLAIAADANVIKLLTSAVDGRLVATKEGLELLRRFGKQPVAIVAFTGKARSGKSFGMNYLLNVPHDAGFRVGHTFAPETQGASIWSEPLAAGGDVAVLLVDTEGLGAGAQVHDKALMAVVSAISSRMVYHALEYIYNEDVLRLHGLAALAEDYARRGVALDAVLPRLAWVVNKCALKKTRANQTALEVLFETCLAERSGKGAEIAQFNATVRVVRAAFGEHAVFLAPSAAPPGYDASLFSLTDVRHADLAADYRVTMDNLRLLLRAETPRSHRGSPPSSPLTGPEIADRIEAILPAANENMTYFCGQVTEDIMQRLVARTRADFVVAVKKVALPMEEGDLARQLRRIEAQCRREFRQASATTMGPALVDKYEAELEDKFEQERLRARADNADASDRQSAQAADEAAQLFSRARITEDDTRDLDIDVFDTAVSYALYKFNKTAIGPGARVHEMELRQRAQAAREEVEAETSPLRKKVLLSGSVGVAAACFALSRCLGKIAGLWAPLVAACDLVEGVGYLSAFVFVMTLLNYLGMDYFSALDTFEWVLRAGAAHAHSLIPVAALAVLLPLFVAYLAKRHQQQRT